MSDDFTYLLTILTNGRRDCFARTIAAYAAHVRPFPSSIFVVDDGGATGEDFVLDSLSVFDGADALYYAPEQVEGMCGAMTHIWRAGRASRHPWVFHLEDDQLILRPVNLRDLALVQASTWGMDTGSLAQMALVRCPWGAEIEHGGYIPKDPGWYTRWSLQPRLDGYTMAPKKRPLTPAVNPDSTRRRGGEFEWIETIRNWATSPALYRAELCQRIDWPQEPNCEGLFGHQLREAYPNTVFGLWGWGECWFSHLGVERAPGAHGY